jgi:hypothetical protein
MSMKNSNDTSENQTCNFPTCSTVPEPTAPPCTPVVHSTYVNIEKIKTFKWKFIFEHHGFGIFSEFVHVFFMKHIKRLHYQKSSTLAHIFNLSVHLTDFSV